MNFPNAYSLLKVDQNSHFEEYYTMLQRISKSDVEEGNKANTVSTKHNNYFKNLPDVHISEEQGSRTLDQSSQSRSEINPKSVKRNKLRKPLINSWANSVNLNFNGSVTFNNYTV